MLDVPCSTSDAACSTIPDATRFTRATGDCFRDDERLLDERLLDDPFDALLLDERLLPLLEPRPDPLLEALRELLLEPLLEPLRELPPELLLDALLRDPVDLRELLLPRELELPPLLRPLPLEELPPRDEPPLDLRDDDVEDFRDDVPDEREDEPPVREPALRLELLRDDFFAAMLDSETRVGWTAYVIPSKNRAQMLRPQE